jgi:hypothetical protein
METPSFETIKSLVYEALNYAFKLQLGRGWDCVNRQGTELYFTVNLEDAIENYHSIRMEPLVEYMDRDNNVCGMINEWVSDMTDMWGEWDIEHKWDVPSQYGYIAFTYVIKLPAYDADRMPA